MPDVVTAKQPLTGAAAPLLAVRGLNAWYGESHILHGVDFDIAAGEVVTLLGRNGAGKTTTLKSIMGVVPRREGSIAFESEETIALSSNRIARRGIAWCPEERGIFASLDVEENLLLPPIVREGGLPLAEIYELFPNLKERLHSQGTKLSGGEQQMLAIGRILRTGARLLLLDEPTAGMTHEDVERIAALIRKVAANRTVLMVEHNLSVVSTLADRITVLARGEILAEGDYASVSQHPEVITAYLGAGHA